MAIDLSALLQILIPVASAVIGYFLRHWHVNVPFMPAPATPGGAPSLPKVGADDLTALVEAVVEKISQKRGAPPSPGQSTHPILDALAKLVAKEMQPPTAPPTV